MKIKVCGMKYRENIGELSKLPIDYMGMIFYPKSPRYIADLDSRLLDNILSENIRSVGVFVNESIDSVLQKINEYNLSCVQLHGNESPDYCVRLKEHRPDICILKAFSISDSSDFKQTESHNKSVDYFLFDTKTEAFGGSGVKFDWSILNSYQGSIPFLLSGGISHTDADNIKKIEHPQFWGIDLNSCFEFEPGLKNIELLNQFIKDIKS